LVVCQERVILRYFTYDGQKYRIKISQPPSLDRTSLTDLYLLRTTEGSEAALVAD
jgi:hypothetical protein